MSLKKRLGRLLEHGLKYYTIANLVNITSQDVEAFFNDEADKAVVDKIKVLVDNLEKMENCIDYYGE